MIIFVRETCSFYCFLLHYNNKGLYAELSYWFFSKIKVFKITARTALKAISLKSQKQADHTEATQ